ncbi:tRNA (adenosine(37)-N6)-dimethylallyltransferase MiaA [Acidiphilium iwatense]|uniref:tRNA dimethylallyltransferase n=1 Tax=Acidiphilium iwatense TaxID=768198 RepID=A0ABS9DSU1_9PROT|nr:tRNA (adenosine(37)-N6)-dimethylallyltransferase MiaA [Acidiphilium iwatense]MCF3945795.1 tRNA (adenosine(37)-N6)-dimethylallyltransferase MiaA [Acidiphilium iwatense]
MDPSPKATPHDRARPLVIVAGPTASGKSALALALAERLAGTIINADAMQCYADWRIITARPSPEDEARAPHRLYGVRGLDQTVDAAWWRQAARTELDRAPLPILCGGTGMYLSALIHGIAAIPDPGAPARAEARGMLAGHGPAWMHDWLAAHDAETAAKLRPTDSQRLARAAEVLLGTGRGLAAWQAMPRDALAGWRIKLILLDPPRDDLRAAITLRFAGMLEAGALDEVRAAAARVLDPALPGLRAHGVPELMAHLAGHLTLDEAERRAIAATIAYTKRQATWFRHQKLADEHCAHTIHARFESMAQFSERIIDYIISFINNPG